MPQDKKEEKIDKIQAQEITTELRDSYLDYAMSVIVSRALPDVRDGMKPVQRRILWAMWDTSLTHSAKFKKSANVVGEVLGKYHPHGDIALYDALARMAQDFSLRYPLIEGQGNWGCFTKDTKVKLTDGRNLGFGELVEEHRQGKKNYTYAVNSAGLICIAEIKNPRLTKKRAELVRVILDNSEEIRCTPNHRFMLKDGTYREARDLKNGSGLMPLYEKLSTAQDRLNREGYTLVYQPRKDEWVPAHHLADNYNLTAEIYPKSAGKVRHHADFNKFNNNPDNVRRLQWGEHWKIHYEHAHLQHQNPEYVRRIAEGRKKFWANPESRLKNSERLAERNYRNWQDPVYREKMCHSLSEVNKEFIKKHPEKRKVFSERATKTLKRLWKDPYYKNLFHEKIVASNKRRVTNNTGKVKFLNVCRTALAQYHILNEAFYEQTRGIVYHYGRATNWSTGVRKYFNGDSNLVLQEINKNHKVIGVETLTDREDVYDLTVDHHHNFALAAGVFVHNSIDGDSPAAMRYCVTGNTLIVTDKGLVPIESLGNSENPEGAEENIKIKVLSKDRSVNPATKWFDSGEHPIIKIETNHGFSLAGSQNHPILTWTQNPITKIPYFSWKPLSEIKEGDVAVIERTSDLLWPEKNVELTACWPQENRRWEKKILPLELNENLAYILGALIAEGTIKENKIEFCNSDTEWINDFKEKWKNVFPDCRLHHFHRKPSSFGKKPYQTLEIHSQQIIKLLKNIGLLPVKSAKKTIPRLILQSPKPVVASFIRAYFEGDGSISQSGRMNELSAISMSERLMEELQIILLRFGMVATKRFDRWRRTHKLYIRGLKNYVLFQDQINFAASVKKMKLGSLVDKIKKDCSQTDFVPFLSEFVRENTENDYKKERITHHYNFDRYSNLENRATGILTAVRTEIKTEAAEIFEALLSNNYLFDPIISIEKGKPEKVYSVKIASECHSFVANGFVNHNTEARLSRIAEEMLLDIDKETVDWQANYDNTREEPKFLPGKLPNLLLNGTVGIAVGMATSIPPHNLGEIADAIAHLIEHPDANIKELMQFMPGPDFPTGGVIYDKRALEEAYSTGRGSVTIRAKAEIEERTHSTRHSTQRVSDSMSSGQGSGSFQIVVTEIPYQVNKSDLITKMAELVTDKKIEGVRDIRDESDREGLRIVVELKNDSSPQKILNQFFEYTELQKNFYYNVLALVGGLQPEILSLKDVLSEYVEHRKIIIRRRTEFDLKKAQDRAHILEGLVRALDAIDKIIATIKKSKDRETAKINLVKNFKLSPLQADAILEMKLQSLAAMERQRLEDELKEKKRVIAELQLILKQPKRILEIIKTDLNDLKKNFADPRRTRIIATGLKEFKEEDLIPQEEAIITFTQDGYVKRMPPNTFRVQKRGGKGLIGSDLKEEDLIYQILSADTHDNIIFFTTGGKAFQTKVYEIPVASRTAKGKSIHNFLEIPPTEKVSAMITYPQSMADGKHFMVMATKSGVIKKTPLADFTNVRRSGIIAIKLGAGDLLGWVKLSEGDDQIVLVSALGQAIRFKEKDIRGMGRGASGVRAIHLKKNDSVSGLDIIRKEDIEKGGKTNLRMVAVMANGFAKQTAIKEYKIQRRGGSGIKTAKITEKTGPVIGAHIVNDETEEVLAFSTKGQAIKTPLKDIRILSRATQGVKIMNLEKGDKLVGIVCL